jgi:phosphoribosylanthranilate isomerase
MKVKLCGVKRPEDIAFMNEFLPDYVGFVFAGTKRRVTVATAEDLAKALNPTIKTVGVFVDEAPDIVANAAKVVGLNAIQLHGAEDAEYLKNIRSLLPHLEIWKAVQAKDAGTILNALMLPADMLLLDSFSPAENGGTGKRADFGLIQSSHIDRPYFLAGGLSCENIVQIVREMSPYGVDISSGIETDGVKNRGKIESIMRILREPAPNRKGGND